MSRMGWEGPEGELGRKLIEHAESRLDSYRSTPDDVQEHARNEIANAEGAYGHRQLYELIQNGADAIKESGERGILRVVLTPQALYCANEGMPISWVGVRALLHSNLSNKRGDEIGRFGLGFKSVLAVTDCPRFYSRTLSFAFDKEYSRQRISEVVPGEQWYPILRIAAPVDPEEDAAQDPVLAELMQWASSVVKLPRTKGDDRWLADDIDEFPGEFLLFSPHVDKVVLEDRERHVVRSIHVHRVGNLLALTQGPGSDTWLVLGGLHSPSLSARKDAGELAERDAVPIMWAVPIRKASPGSFWAFFPTEYLTTLSGILNAPWKTNVDRSQLLKGDFNYELIEYAANMITDHIADIVAEQLEPGAYLDFMPGRGAEERNWADGLLTRRIWSLCAEKPSLPDQDGKLRLPHELLVHPKELSPEALMAWHTTPGRPTNWVHPSVETANQRNRRARLEELIPEGNVKSIDQWLEALVSNPAVESSSAALLVADLALDPKAQGRYVAVPDAAIIAMSDGTFASPRDLGVFLPMEGAESESGERCVHATLAQDARIRYILQKMGVQSVSPASLLKDYLLKKRLCMAVRDWAAVWKLARACDTAEAFECIRAARFSSRYSAPHVRNIDGEWLRLADVLLPGAVVPADGSRDAKYAIDIVYHSDDLELIRMFGGTASPEAGRTPAQESWYAGFLAECRLAYQAAQDRDPHLHLLRFDNLEYVGPIGPLAGLSEEGRMLFTQAYLELGPSASCWVMRHSTQPQYPPMEFENPCIRELRLHGVVQTSIGARPLAECVGGELRRLDRFLPVPTLRESAFSPFELPCHGEDLSEAAWATAFERALGLEEVEALTNFYIFASAYIATPPAEVRCVVRGKVTTRRVHDVFVTSSPPVAKALAHNGTPYLPVRDAVAEAQLVVQWGMASGAEEIDLDVEVLGQMVLGPLSDEYPALEMYMEDARDFELSRCEELNQVILSASGRTSEPIEFHVRGRELLAVSSLDDCELLLRINAGLGLGLSEADISAILSAVESRHAQQRRSFVKQAVGVAAKLACAVGRDRIVRRLPRGLLDEVPTALSDTTGETAAHVAEAVYGVELLQTFKAELAEVGLRPPERWAGSDAALAFCSALGFPLELAGFESEDRRPNVEVDGPVLLPELHDYQSVISDRVRGMANGSEGFRRAMLSLPTGAGKTRVAAEALAGAVVNGDVRSIVWIAQSDELCEQAVRSWNDVWRSLGQGRLRISRLWDTNEVDAALNAPHLVVATIDKLSSILRRQGGSVDDGQAYDWLWTNSDFLVIDEAHGSLSGEYRKVLGAFGVERTGSGNHCPVLGMTATPFRGNSEEQTRQLVEVYGGNRLDQEVLGDDPYALLQERGVLARVTHKLLTGSTIELAPDELDLLKRTRKLPASVGVRVGADASRNRKIVDSVKTDARNLSVLLFAASVEHAQIVAALLDSAGIPARSVSSDTRTGARRHYVQQFRRGDIQVLTNYGIFTEGFDAPATQAIYVTRPTFSPNVYQQMIGRGLRGPVNGGTDECLIVNVQDNVSNYGEALAFTRFEYLWSAGKGEHE